MIEKMPCKVTLHQSEGSPTLTQTPENEGWGIKEDQIPSSSHLLHQTMDSQLQFLLLELLNAPQPANYNLARAYT